MSAIHDTELIQGDSSPIYFFGHEDNIVLGPQWECKYSILTKFGETPVHEEIVPLNTGTGTGDNYDAGTRFVFQITPTVSETLAVQTKYIVAVQIKNQDIGYTHEIAQFKLKILPQGVI